MPYRNQPRFVAAFAAAATVGLAQSPAFPLAAAAEKAGNSLGAGGIVVAEAQGGQVHYAAAGHPAPRADVAPERIIFEIGSITKVFTSLLLAQAVGEGRAALSDPIAKFLPADLKLDPRVAAITLEQLATHTSGLPRVPDNLEPSRQADPYADYTVERLYRFLTAYRPARPAPQPAEYSNLGAGLLGHLLERLYGKTYAALVEEKITGPLGLVDTVVELSAEQQSRFALPYSGTMRVLPWHLGALAGAGALHSTAADLVKFAQALMSPASPLQAAWDLARQPRAEFGSPGDRIGLAILTAEVDGERIYNHGGGTGGFRSFLEFAPQSGRLAVVLLNNDSPEPAGLVAATRHPAAVAKSAVTAREETPLPADQLADYPGVYVIDARARFTAVLDAAGRLQVRLIGQPFFPAYHDADDRFFLKVVPAEYAFGRDAGGKVVSLTLHQNGREVPARRTAEPPPVVLFLSADKLGEYPGRFRLTPDAVFDVSSRSGHLFVKLTGQPAWPVFCDRADHFVYDVVDAGLTFERDAAGAVTALVLHQNGADRRAGRIAADSK